MVNSCDRKWGNVTLLLHRHKIVPFFFHFPAVNDIHDVIDGYGGLSNVGGNDNLSDAYRRLSKHSRLFFTWQRWMKWVNNTSERRQKHMKANSTEIGFRGLISINTHTATRSISGCSSSVLKASFSQWERSFWASQIIYSVLETKTWRKMLECDSEANKSREIINGYSTSDKPRAS